jgi:hypothetical protein
MDWKHYVLALPIALFLLFLAFSFAGDTPEVIAEDEPVAAEALIDPIDVDGYVLRQDCDDDSSDEDGDNAEEEGDEDSESEDEDGDEDSSDEDCPEEEEGGEDED